MMIDAEIPSHDAAHSLGVSRFSYHRAVLSRENGRVPFIRGRQKIVSDFESSLVREWIQLRIDSKQRTRTIDVRDYLNRVIREHDFEHGAEFRELVSNRTVRRLIATLFFSHRKGTLVDKHRATVNRGDPIPGRIPAAY